MIFITAGALPGLEWRISATQKTYPAAQAGGHPEGPPRRHGAGQARHLGPARHCWLLNQRAPNAIDGILFRSQHHHRRDPVAGLHVEQADALGGAARFADGF